jgi:putative SOS response-associated peptidase YedK
MALAGLWENWRSPAGEWVRSFAIVTCPPNPLCAELHDRMPVLLTPEAWPLWLGEEPADPRHLNSHSPDEAAILSALAEVQGVKFSCLRGIEWGVDGGPDG